jgi:hypothetical protein
MLDEYSIEQHAKQIFDARTKECFSVVFSCYAAGNYSSTASVDHRERRAPVLEIKTETELTEYRICGRHVD